MAVVRDSSGRVLEEALVCRMGRGVRESGVPRTGDEGALVTVIRRLGSIGGGEGREGDWVEEADTKVSWDEVELVEARRWKSDCASSRLISCDDGGSGGSGVSKVPEPAWRLLLSSC
jgi:hypothetical protein